MVAKIQLIRHFSNYQVACCFFILQAGRESQGRFTLVFALRSDFVITLQRYEESSAPPNIGGIHSRFSSNVKIGAMVGLCTPSLSVQAVGEADESVHAARRPRNVIILRLKLRFSACGQGRGKSRALRGYEATLSEFDGATGRKGVTFILYILLCI